MKFWEFLSEGSAAKAEKVPKWTNFEKKQHKNKYTFKLFGFCKTA